MATGAAAEKQLGARARFVKADATSEEAVEAAISAAVSAFGALHGVVNTAGIGTAAKVLGKNGPHALDLFAKAWTKALRLCLGEEPGALDAADRAALAALARRADPERILEILERCLAAERQIALYIQTPLVLEGLVESCARILEENPAAGAVSSSKQSGGAGADRGGRV